MLPIFVRVGCHARLANGVPKAIPAVRDEESADWSHGAWRRGAWGRGVDETAASVGWVDAVVFDISQIGEPLLGRETNTSLCCCFFLLLVLFFF